MGQAEWVTVPISARDTDGPLFFTEHEWATVEAATARIIPTDGRPHAPAALRRFLGDSIGRWEGQTLVVDTTNFTNRTSFRGASDRLHLVERFSRADADTLLYEFSVDDPTSFTKPWRVELPMKATDEQVFEYACHEGNEALAGILRGARFEERQAGPR